MIGATGQAHARAEPVRDVEAEALSESILGLGNSVAGAGRLQVSPDAIDVREVSNDRIRALKSSSSAIDRRLGATIERARSAYADVSSAGGRLVVLKSPGNGNQPVLVIVAPGFDAEKPAVVHTHYHGWNSTVAEPRGHSAGAGARIREVQAASPQAVFVLPECRNAPVGGGSYATDWSNVSSEASTTEDALRAAGITKVAVRIVSAHSGGGSALANAIRGNADGSGLRADRLELLDSLYGSEAAIAGWAKTKNGGALGELEYFRGTNDAGRDRAISKAFGDRYARRDMAKERAIDLQNDPILKDASGKSLGRKFAPDPHNRTVGEFMGQPFVP